MLSLMQERIAGQIYLSGHKALRQFTPVRICINASLSIIPDLCEIFGLVHSLPARRSCSVLFAVSEIAECFHPKSMLWLQDHLSIWLVPYFISHLTGFRPLASLCLTFPVYSDWYRRAEVAFEPWVGQAWPLWTLLNTSTKEVTSLEIYQPFFK